MTRKTSPLTIAVLTGAVAFGATPVWSGGDSEHGQGRDHTSMQQPSENRDQTAMGGNSTSASEMKSQDVKEVQESLKQGGHDPGPINGVLGTQTQAALRSFQQSSGLQPTGQLDQETVAQLGIKEQSSGQSSASYGESSAGSEERSTSFRGNSTDSEQSGTNSAESSSSS